MKKIVVDGWAYLVLSSTGSIEKGEELKYNYGKSDLKWRENVNILYFIL